MTTKHDKARLLHLRIDPKATADWTQALREKTRSQLDTDIPDADPWNSLAEKFNNYDENIYYNAVIKRNILSTAGLYVAEVNMGAVALECHELNPSMDARPMRDATWVRNQCRDLKGKLSLCFTNYRRSGNQAEENRYDEWVKYSTAFNNDVVIYAIALLNSNIMDQIGRALPEDIQRDTGALEKSDTYESRKAYAQERKRVRREGKSRRDVEKLASPDDSLLSPRVSHTPRTFLASILEVSVIEQNNIAITQAESTTKLVALKVIMDFGSVEDKAKAYATLKEFAGIPQYQHFWKIYNTSVN